jgi:phage anti-repressor protein
MKTLILFIAIALSAQIVNAADIKDATLKEKGKQNEASTIAWLKSTAPDASLINMAIGHFNKGFKQCLSEFNQKYKTFPVITSDVINDQILPQLYTEDLVEGKLYTFSYWDATNQVWGRWVRKAKKGETGLFYPGWAEPIMSVYCWNFGYPDESPAPAPVSKTEVVIIPGVNKYYYKTDTIRERYDNYKEVENNFFVNTRNNTFTNTNNQSFDVETNNAKYASNNVQDNCRCQQQQQNNSCGCGNGYICNKHYDQLPEKEKKKFGQTTVGKGLKYLLAYGLGVGTGLIIANNTGGSSSSPVGQTITQGPLDLIPVPVNGIIVTQAPNYN